MFNLPPPAESSKDSQATKVLTLPVAKVFLLAMSEHLGLKPEVIETQFCVGRGEARLLKQHPQFSKVLAFLTVSSNESPDEKMARAEGKAVDRLISLISNGGDREALTAIKEVLDRLKGKPVQTQRTISASVTLNVDPMQLKSEREQAEERLRILREQRGRMLRENGNENIVNAEIIEPSKRIIPIDDL